MSSIPTGKRMCFLKINKEHPKKLFICITSIDNRYSEFQAGAIRTQGLQASYKFTQEQ